MTTKQVTVMIGGYPFECVPLAQAAFPDQAAVYVILCVSEGGSWTVLDVGQTGEVGARIDSHDRRQSWESTCQTRNIWVCVYLMSSAKYSEQDRRDLEHALRQQYKPPCGER